MTDNNIGKNLYWFYAIYISILPVSIIIGIVSLLKYWFNIDTNFLGIIYLPLWILAIIICALVIKKPFLKSYDKYKWDYDGNQLRNINNSIVIKNDEMQNIYIGYDGPGKRQFVLNKLVEISKMTSLVIKTKDNKIIILQFALLNNGQELQEKLINNNKDKLVSIKFQLKQKPKFYKLMEIKK
jgi:hypothetical protein